MIKGCTSTFLGNYTERDIKTGETKTFFLNLQIQRSLVFQTLQVYKSRLSSNLNKKRAKFCKSSLLFTQLLTLPITEMAVCSFSCLVKFWLRMSFLSFYLLTYTSYAMPIIYLKETIFYEIFVSVVSSKYDLDESRS